MPPGFWPVDEGLGDNRDVEAQGAAAPQQVSINGHPGGINEGGEEQRDGERRTVCFLE